VPSFIKYIGKRFPNSNSKVKSHFGLFKCECGVEFETYIKISSNTPISAKSCGCLQIKQVSSLNRKHSESRSKLYARRNSMIQRCTNPNSKSYKDYGGRGIDVCKEWLESYESYRNFILSIGYKENLEIDRIDNNKGYFPDNVRIVGRSEQCQNTRIHKTNSSGYRGVRRSSKNRWRASIYVNNKEIPLGYFNSSEDGAIAYNAYVVANNTKHPLNIIKD